MKFILLLSSLIYAAPKGLFLFIKGDVQIESEKLGMQPAKKGQSLFANSKVKIGKDSFAVIVLQDGSKVKLSENSFVTWKSFIDQRNKLILGETNLLLQAGSALVNIIPGNTNQVFNVKVKDVTMGVRGTNFFTGLDNNDLFVSVEKGEIEVKKGNNREALMPGEGMVIERGKNFTKPQKFKWVKDLKYNLNNNKIKHFDNFRKNRRSRIKEFLAKRKRWSPNESRFKARKKVWDRRKKNIKKKIQKFKNKKVNNISRDKKGNTRQETIKRLKKNQMRNRIQKQIKRKVMNRNKNLKKDKLKNIQKRKEDLQKRLPPPPPPRK